jgi:hypothetical protein
MVLCPGVLDFASPADEPGPSVAFGMRRSAGGARHFLIVVALISGFSRRLGKAGAGARVSP